MMDAAIIYALLVGLTNASRSPFGLALAVTCGFVLLTVVVGMIAA